MRNLICLVVWLLACYGSVLAQEQQDINALEWPIDFTQNGRTYTLYQPQVDAMEQILIAGRMAIQIKTDPDSAPIFGAIFFDAKLSTNVDDRVAVLRKFDVTKEKFPDIPDSQVSSFTKDITTFIEGQNLVMSMDDLMGSIELRQKQGDDPKFDNSPPHIYVRQTSAMLISIDGDPILKNSDDKNIQYVVNTPFFIVKYKSEFYLKGGKFWYESGSITSGWNSTEKVPGKVEKFAKKNQTQETVSDSLTEKLTEPPEIIVTTEPAELIVTDGEPDFQSVEGTNLLYLANSGSDVIMDINAQQYFILLAGRWYTSKKLAEGDWAFVNPKELPEDFAKIPTESDINDVRPSVPGTPEAEDALLQQSIPQTASVNRKDTKTDVNYDGQPKFDQVEGTSMQYALNSDQQVLRDGNKYYTVDEGVWFVSNSPNGPWEVATTRPQEVDDIPPDNPNYNTKYVYIYDSTPEVVYVGYLPGYNYSYIYGGTVVYGTGYYYRPWYGSVYYPRPFTWGFNVHYNPWTGWGFSFGFSMGWIGWGYHSYPGWGWWGPCGYRPGYRHGYYHGYRHGYNRGYARGYANGYYNSRNRAYRNNVYNNNRRGVRTVNNNVYRSRDVASSTRTSRPGTTGRPSTGSRNNSSTRQPSTRQNSSTRNSTSRNNRYTDRDGNVYQRGNSGNWERLNNSNRSSSGSTRPNTGSSTRPSNSGTTRPNTTRPSTTRPNTTRPSTTSPSTRPSNRNLERSYQNRSRGSQNRSHYQRNYSRPNTGSMNRSRSMPSRSGGRTGGGRRP
ncbi:hypothetical protein [Pontibacter sp. G13]|uniref:hypothetical protein n=1 Tax=Pontibacter sp. G13 TaxID=3074898 RepID=UPI00288A5C9A|nr:hypothetical protein [Pontibacter sp. G13]WNJ17388.1 hypothetical protein RJD25_21275 [Pontibacter sp. G13]